MEEGNPSTVKNPFVRGNLGNIWKLYQEKSQTIFGGLIPSQSLIKVKSHHELISSLNPQDYRFKSQEDTSIMKEMKNLTFWSLAWQRTSSKLIFLLNSSAPTAMHQKAKHL